MREEGEGDNERGRVGGKEGKEEKEGEEEG